MSEGLPAYAELHCLSNFTFLRGASHPEELVERAAALGYTALALTDECSVAGVVRAHVKAKALGMRLIIGSEFSIGQSGGNSMRLVLLATDRRSYGRLCAFITRGRRRAQKGGYHLQREDIAEEGLPGCLALWLPGSVPSLDEAHWLAQTLPGRVWIAVELHHGPNDRRRLAQLQEIGATSGLRLVAMGDVHMHLRSRRRLQDTLTAIRLGQPVRECGHALFPNAERHLRSRLRLAQHYPPELLRETLVIAGRCAFSLDTLRYEYPRELVPAGHTATSWLHALTEQGLRRRYPAPAGVPPEVGQQIERELALIATLGYESFFLTVEDIVSFSRSRGILCQGRGSAANSAVCFALGITEVDPYNASLLFERFVSKERNEPPDIDVDFEHQRREEVIQYIYGKYGRERAALAATVICYRLKSALRDAGRALGLDPEETGRIARAVTWWDRGDTLAQRLQEAGLDIAVTGTQRLISLAQALTGFPRHLSQHVGGFVISRGPLARLVPVENAAMPERSVIQWDKDDLDALGLLKVDVLALGMLSAIRRALGLVSQATARPLTMADVPVDDPEVYGMIQRADTVGVFQIESRAQMAMLPRLRPTSFYDLVIEVAIVRPGPIQGGMVHPFLKRRMGLEPVTYESPEVEQVLRRTLGVPIFQEQVMQLAVVAAGFSPGEADQLRRAMAAWRRSGDLARFEARLLAGMRKRGYSDDFAGCLYRQILGFGEYGFPESHSASFALLVYISSWLKYHHPAAFCAGLLNSQPMGFYGPSQLVQDARRHGVEFRPVDIMRSDWECTLEQGAGTDVRAAGAPPASPALRLGLLMVKGLARESALRIIEARGGAVFSSAQDLADRAGIGGRELRLLASAGALTGLSSNRREALWSVLGVEQQPGLMRGAPVQESPVQMELPGEGETLVADYRSLGLTLGRHPLALLRPRLRKLKMRTAQEVLGLAHGTPVRASGLVTTRQRPGTASGVVFVTLEDETGNVNLVVWRDVAERFRNALLGARLMRAEGVIERSGEVVHLVARRLFDDSALLGRLTTRSRDFH